MPSVRPCRSIKALVPDEEVSLCQMSNKTSAWVVLNPHAAVRHTLPNWHLFGSISNECISNVLSFLDGQSLAAASQVCSQLHVLASEDDLWLRVCRQEWGVVPDQLQKVEQPVEVKKLYQFAVHNMRRMAQRMMQEHLLLSLQRATMPNLMPFMATPSHTAFLYPA
ncbi:hypothetical protein AeMF1_010424 [Aphanomyces euteiches]|nr:hypothetical protein AeMF1_010424 [Aphanomyces euteiches]KAH9193552.1 hypothetical protein AeNC1_004475 [Aphanomyces euteiches]